MTMTKCCNQNFYRKISNIDFMQMNPSQTTNLLLTKLDVWPGHMAACIPKYRRLTSHLGILLKQFVIIIYRQVHHHSHQINAKLALNLLCILVFTLFYFSLFYFKQ